MSRLLQDGVPTLLALRLDGLGFQLALHGEVPDFEHAWQHVGDSFRDLVGTWPRPSCLKAIAIGRYMA